MTEIRYCACGCGGELKVWKNGRTGPFLRGHHMRKLGYKLPQPGIHYCACGCGSEIIPLKNGHIRKYIKGHHLKGKELDIAYRIERTRKRWGREPILSPYVPETFLGYDKKAKRWTACVRTTNGKSKNTSHANAVYRHHFGDIPDGYVVHHKSGMASRIEDDRPENLMLLPDKWNLRYFPTLAGGFGVEERIVTNTYLDIEKEGKSEPQLFSELCTLLIERISS